VNTEGAVSEVKTLTVLKATSTISINLSLTTIDLGENVTINGKITADDPVDPVRANASVTIEYKPTDGTWELVPKSILTDQNSNYTLTWGPEAVGTYEVRASWSGDVNTEGAVSEVKTLTVLKATSTISINLRIEYKPSGGTWGTLATVKTNQYSNYTYPWTPETAGNYEVRASWSGDVNTEGDVSEVKALTVQEAPETVIDPYIVVAAVVAIIIIAAIVIYFVKIRKPKP